VTVELRGWQTGRVIRARRLRQAVEADPRVRTVSRVATNSLPQLVLRTDVSPSVDIEVVADSPGAASRAAAEDVQNALDLIGAECSAQAWIVGTDGIPRGADQ
jgi:hypothetical protein